MKITGIIGDPVSHSLSPAMQNRAFRRTKTDYCYLPFRVTPKGLSSFVRKARAWKDLVGFNVTIPHKEKILSHLQKLSPQARVIGAVNTVVVSRGRWMGYNTDAPGYLRSLSEETGFHPRGKTVLILGAGGATRAVAAALAGAGAKRITIANRTPARAKGVALEFSRCFPKTRWSAEPLSRASLLEIFPETDLLVNATSVGLKGTRFRDLPLQKLRKDAIVSDLVYRPLITPLLREANKRGLKIHPGLGMLLHQGALAFELWTKKRPDLKVMKQALLDAFKRS